MGRSLNVLSNLQLNIHTYIYIYIHTYNRKLSAWEGAWMCCQICCWGRNNSPVTVESISWIIASQCDDKLPWLMITLIITISWFIITLWLSCNNNIDYNDLCWHGLSWLMITLIIMIYDNIWIIMILDNIWIIMIHDNIDYHVHNLLPVYDRGGKREREGEKGILYACLNY